MNFKARYVINQIKFIYLYIFSFSAFQQGVNMNMGDYDGRTALHLASAEGHLRCVRFLLDVCKVKNDIFR